MVAVELNTVAPQSMSMHLRLELSQPLLPRLQVALQAHNVLCRKQPVPCVSAQVCDRAGAVLVLKHTAELMPDLDVSHVSHLPALPLTA